MRSSARHTAFTLVELLVVVAIIVALLAILLPSISRAAELASRVTCAARLQQLGVATLTFASDSFLRLPDLGPGSSSVSQGSNPVIFYWSIPDTDRLRKQYLADDYRLMQCPNYDSSFGLDQHIGPYTHEPHGTDFRHAGYFTSLTFRCQPAYPNGTIDVDGDGLGDQLRLLTLRDKLKTEPAIFGDFVGLLEPGVWWVAAKLHADRGGGPAGGNNLYRDGSVAWANFAQMTVNYSHSAYVGDGLRDMYWRNR